MFMLHINDWKNECILRIGNWKKEAVVSFLKELPHCYAGAEGEDRRQTEQNTAKTDIKTKTRRCSRPRRTVWPTDCLSVASNLDSH
jgi:hypothetical protein